MGKNPLEVIEKNDPEFIKLINAKRDSAMGEGAIPVKYKILIALALDAAHGAVNGVRSLALQAMEKGATKEEIMETIRVTGHISGVGSVYTAAAGISEVL